MSLRILFKNDKKDILKKLEYYGLEKLPYLLIESGKEKVRGYSGKLSTEELMELSNKVGIQIAGLYLLHNYPDELRLSPEAILALKDKITKNIIEITESQAKEWFRGQDIILTEQDKERYKNEARGFKVIKFNDDLIGTGKLIENRIVNYLPKERRLKK